MAVSMIGPRTPCVAQSEPGKTLKQKTKVVDLFQTWDSAAVWHAPIASRASSTPVHSLCRFPNYINVQSTQMYDRISVGTVVDDLCARGGVGTRDAMLLSLIYIEGN